MQKIVGLPAADVGMRVETVSLDAPHVTLRSANVGLCAPLPPSARSALFCLALRREDTKGSVGLWSLMTTHGMRIYGV
jgi:hypothetical protein